MSKFTTKALDSHAAYDRVLSVIEGAEGIEEKYPDLAAEFKKNGVTPAYALTLRSVCLMTEHPQDVAALFAYKHAGKGRDEQELKFGIPLSKQAAEVFKDIDPERGVELAQKVKAYLAPNTDNFLYMGVNAYLGANKGWNSPQV